MPDPATGGAGAGVGEVLRVLHKELRALSRQRNIKDWESHSIRQDTYRVFEQNLIIRLKIETKWPSFRNDKLEIPPIFDFQAIWRDDDRNPFEEDVVEERTITADGREKLTLNWRSIVKNGQPTGGEGAFCYLELGLPEDQEAFSEHIAPDSEGYDAFLEPKEDVNKIGKLITTEARDKSEEFPTDIDSLPSPDEYVYESNGDRALPHKIEHVERVEYNLDFDKGGFKKERTSKTYVEIEDIELDDANPRIRLEYND